MIMRLTIGSAARRRHPTAFVGVRFLAEIPPTFARGTAASAARSVRPIDVLQHDLPHTSLTLYRTLRDGHLPTKEILFPAVPHAPDAAPGR